MEINVSQQIKSPIGTTRHYDIEYKLRMDGTDHMVKGEITLIRTDRGILASGTVSTARTLSCSRCLSEFDHPLSLTVNEEYFPLADTDSDSPDWSPADPGSFMIDENNILDLGEAFRQYAVMATPLKPLCTHDCAGLCPTCGTNLNLNTCDCPKVIADSRWEVLQQLVHKES